MPYIGNPAVVGDSANTFRLLDDITSFTVTFDATDSSVVSIANNTLTFSNHRFVTGQKVTYNDGGGTAIGGLSDGSYFIIKEDQSTIKLASSASNATAGTAIDLTSGAAGGSHTLNIAFDGVNTKFKATFNNGTKAKISRAAQLSLSINGVLQQPQDTTSPTVGYGIEADSTIVFSTAPESSDVIFGSFIGEVAASFDITDNTVDEFTANGSTTTFTLSKTVPSSNDVLVTLDGVTQYPTTQSNTRAYSVLENVLTFTSAPAAGVIIQARHIGFAGASSSAVTGFYGRTGNVSLKNTDDVAVQNISAGIATFTGALTVGGDLNVTGDLTYDETVARNLNITGVATVASGIVSTGDFKIGTATTLSQDNIFTTGIVTATTFVGNVTGNVTGNSDTATTATNSTNSTNASHVLVTDNESTNENNLITFVEDATSSTGNVGLEMDGNLTYNPSTGTVSATAFSGSGANLTNLPAANLTGTLPAIDGSNLTGVASINWQSSIKTSNFSASSNEGYWINTTSNTVTVTFPSSASVGDTIELVDFARTWGSNKIIIDSNGLNYQGQADTYNVEYDTSGQALRVVYSGATKGWIPTSDEVSENNPTPPPYSLDFLVIAGGGGGGGHSGAPGFSAGGGGAGGYRNSYSSETSGGGGSSESSLTVTPNVVYTVTVGGAGSGGGVSNNGANGSNSSISGSDITTITSTGGGGGGARSQNGVSGGSGGAGGGSSSGKSGASGTSGQGYAGGNTLCRSGVSGQRDGSGGGGGASAAGASTSNTKTGGAGGAGASSSITGSSVTRAGGGGGGGQNAGSGGSGGGGAGGYQGGADGSVGSSNTGGGGGGGNGGDSSGGAGGSGVVILRMATASYSGTTSGSPSVTTSGSDTILTFTGSGTYTA